MILSLFSVLQGLSIAPLIDLVLDLEDGTKYAFYPPITLFT